MLGLFYPYGIILQALAILHFVRRRPDTFWLWIILIGGGLGALAYIVAEVVPDVGLLRGTFQIFSRRKRINQLEAAIIDNPSIGNYEELGDLYLGSTRRLENASTASSRRAPNLSIRFTEGRSPPSNSATFNPRPTTSPGSSKAIPGTTTSAPQACLRTRSASSAVTKKRPPALPK